MIRQFKQIEANQPRTLTKIKKKHELKQLLTLDHVKTMRDTPLVLGTFQRHARKFYVTQLLGNSLTLRHPYTDSNGRYIKTVVLDFSTFVKDGYVHVRPFKPSKENSYGNTEGFCYALKAKTHKDLYRKLFKHNLL
ncbi:hypothetical protein [Flagellimonas aequoris]|uniref:Uncharacterized protein n=1 Tax=Flagellimonas aequoris TaxID=2306997 RepID=A0A418N496_9FLAO|nr:hypothetical protein [Allomuricauda aequoris]RIV68721.1 hypothetical protein D2U88_16155 [Allomuricauda aequoris]TXK00418.1 hypothetical protein FQ019_15965 [Allomuricauda aequoris]